LKIQRDTKIKQILEPDKTCQNRQCFDFNTWLGHRTTDDPRDVGYPILLRKS
jgi:hypothetical protein